jgi:hypothetical protein
MPIPQYHIMILAGIQSVFLIAIIGRCGQWPTLDI